MGFFTNKVKSVIKQKIASNLISGFQNAAFGQPKKLAAKLASKSPLDCHKVLWLIWDKWLTHIIMVSHHTHKRQLI